MDLENFISETLVSVKKGLCSANEALVEEGEILGKDAMATFLIGTDGSEKIYFDIAVMASKNTKNEGAGMIKVMSISIGGSLNKAEAQEHVSRIKFSVHSSKITG